MNFQEKFSALSEDIAHYNELGTTPVNRLMGVLSAVRISLNELKDFLAANPFKGQTAEINFFKYEKPRFFAEQLFALEVYTVEANKPIGDEVLQKAYYEQELRFIKRFLDQHRFFYQYYLLGGTELDSAYFVRGTQPPLPYLPDAPEPDPSFSTAGDFLFAKFIALERLQDYLIGILYPSAEIKPRGFVSRKGKKLKWTGDKSNLVELAYGIYFTAQLNDGNATIAEIIEWLEDTLEINLGRVYRRFNEIKMRKDMSRTRFIEEMRQTLLNNMDGGDAFIAEK